MHKSAYLNFAYDFYYCYSYRQDFFKNASLRAILSSLAKLAQQNSPYEPSDKPSISLKTPHLLQTLFKLVCLTFVDY